MPYNPRTPGGPQQMPSRRELEALEKRPYKFQPYPACRYHPSGETKLVHTEQQDAELGDPWRDTPYPPAPKAPAGHTMAELKAHAEALFALQMRELEEQNACLHQNLRQLADEHKALQAQFDAQGKLLAKNDEMIQALREELAGRKEESADDSKPDAESPDAKSGKAKTARAK